MVCMALRMLVRMSARLGGVDIFSPKPLSPLHLY
jgi:hypothetical protein